jgi:hypothetical protein
MYIMKNYKIFAFLIVFAFLFTSSFAYVQAKSNDSNSKYQQEYKKKIEAKEKQEKESKEKKDKEEKERKDKSKKEKEEKEKKNYKPSSKDNCDCKNHKDSKYHYNHKPHYGHGGNHGHKDCEDTDVIDTTDPIITINGESVVTVMLGSTYTDAGATATDNVDGTITVTTTGSVNTSTVGTYTITYTATDAANNTATSSRVVIVVTPPDTTAPVITLNGDAVMPIIVNTTFTDPGATATDDVDGTVSVSVSGTVDNTQIGSYTLTYTATDAASNTATLTRKVNVATNIYSPHNTFGTGNGDGNDWQAWYFNGSIFYDWHNSYVGGYLKEEFKMLRFGSGVYFCSQCIVHGIFTTNPLQGFEFSSQQNLGLEGNPQHAGLNYTYDIVLQWDSTGYTYDISHDGIPFTQGHTDIANVDENMWSAWGNRSGDKPIFSSPTGDWMGPLIGDLSGGMNMTLAPNPVYRP